jgi:hypothetical protein
MPEGASGAKRRRDAARPGTPTSRRDQVRPHDIRDVLERASARETAARVAPGRLAASCSDASASHREPRVRHRRRRAAGDASCRFDERTALPDDTASMRRRERAAAR